MKKGLFSKLVVSFVIVVNVLFAMSILYIFYKTNSEPAILIGAWFAFTTGELWQLGQIKKKKEEKRND